MRRRSKGGGEPTKTQRRRTGARKSRNAPKRIPRRASSAADGKTLNAQLTRERDEALEQQTATAEVLKALSRSTFDLHSVLSSLLEKAVRLSGAEMGLIYRQDGDVYRVAASFGHSVEFLEKMKQNPIYEDRGSATGRAVLERRVVHIPDTLADADYRWGLNIRSEKQMHRTILAVPMLKGGAIIGVIVIRRTKIQPFTDRQIAVLSNFADQAVIAIENARLVSELQESLQQQTATADVLKIISRSAFDLQSVLDTLIELAARLCAADRGSIQMRHEDVYRMRAHYGLAREAVEYSSLHPMRPDRRTATGRVALEGKPIHIPDVLVDPEYHAPDYQQAFQYRTILSVPLQRDGATIGVFSLLRGEVSPFTDRQIELATTFANQAVIAIENVRLFDEVEARTSELQETLEYQTAASDVLNVISRSPSDIQPVLETIAETAQRLCHAEQAYIMRLDGGLYYLAAAKDAQPERIEYLKKNPIVPDRGSVTGRVAIERGTVHITDAQLDPEYTLEMVGDAGYRTILGVPLIREGDPIGVIILTRGIAQPFTEKQIELVTTFADEAVIAIENARLFEAEQQRTEELAESLEQQTATSRVLEVISRSAFDLQTVFETVAEKLSPALRCR